MNTEIPSLERRPLDERDLPNPLASAEASLRLGAPVAPFLRPGRWVVHDPELVRIVLGKEHAVFVEGEHPYPELRPILSESGRRALELRPEPVRGCPHIGGDASASPTPSCSVRQVIALAREDTAFLHDVNGRTPDLFPVFGTLTLRTMVKLLFDVDLGPTARDFFAAMAVHEDFLSMSRRGSADVAAEDDRMREGTQAMRRQMEIATRIVEDALTARGGDARSAAPPPLHRALLRTMVNAYLGIANTLGWTLWSLTSRPDVQSELAAEAERLFAELDCRVEDAPLHASRMRMIVDETLRLYPPVWMLSRITTRDFVLGGQLLPARSDVMIFPYTLHRDPRFWEAPERFLPERFAAGPNRTARHPYAYLPFGAGVHRCVGGRTAMGVIVTLLATLLKDFAFARTPGVVLRPQPLVLLRPAPAVIFDVTPRARG